MDALTLKDWPERFDSVIDSGLFHVFSDDDRRRYVEGLAHVLKPGGRLFLLCFSDEEPGTQGPRRVSQKETAGRLRRGLGRRVHRAGQVRGPARPEGLDRSARAGRRRGSWWCGGPADVQAVSGQHGNHVESVQPRTPYRPRR